MKQEIKDRWTTALRSGQYEQGTAMLMDDEGRHCGLGVLCDVLGREVLPFGSDDNHGELYGLIGEMLPDFGTLMRMNDNMGMTFAEIADWIDANIAVTP